ncbi:hypothetical protein JRG66_11735 [Salinimicrobium tongyeongense]|uniref:Uncharacterized protein n=1 Tax=Salinimicrobium tongyeongense TaxID=2809707 RepID=A0ABY6NP47_9FLAO|nr:hypothetical protein [Salinimicrobium tongyeongense]UZH54637.1 hypothetical protein JRG66_11735 [Salinimicrobium tongyeongense]
MKTTITRFSRRLVLFSGMLMISALLWNCDTQDLEFIDPYEFVNDDFDEIPDLSPVEDEDPEIVEPEVGAVQESAETKSLVTDVLNAGATGGISPESEEKLQTLQSYTQQLPASVSQQAQNLTPADISDILDPAKALNSDLDQLKESLKSAPAEVKALLPTIQFTTDLEGLDNMAADYSNQQQSVFNTLSGSPIETFMQTVSGPCAEAAYDAYDTRLQELTEQRDANFFTIESNYARRVDEADARLAERQNAQAERLETIRTEMIDATNDILAAAEEAESHGETQIAEQLRELALLYAVDARTALSEWNSLVLELLDVKMEQEKAQALEIREDKTAEVTAEFAAAKAQADALLQEALNDCHNQGSGN